MRKLICILLVPLTILCGIYVYTLYNAVIIYQNNAASKDEAFYNALKPEKAAGEQEVPHVYKVYINDEYVKTFNTYDEAVLFASENDYSSVYENVTASWVWDNYPPYELNTGEFSLTFKSFAEAAAAAKDYEGSFIVYKKTSSTIWVDNYTGGNGEIIDAPLIQQYPELDRGCEVTSAAMLLRHSGIDADKMILAEEIAKHENNPHKGFVGDIYSFSNPGFGVYHEPVYNLLFQYMPNSIMDLTGADFQDFFYILDKGRPVWVIINSMFAPLPASSFTNLQTDEGSISITYHEHSVLITGYDSQYIYFNDPNSVTGEMSKASKENFISAWEQMGRQAIAVSP